MKVIKYAGSEAEFKFTGFMKIMSFFMNSGMFKKQSYRYMEGFKAFAEGTRVRKLKSPSRGLKKSSRCFLIRPFFPEPFPVVPNSLLHILSQHQDSK